MVLPAVVLPAGQPRGWALPTYIPFMYLPTPSRAHHPVNASKSRTVDINKDEVLFCSFCPGGKFSGGKGGEGGGTHVLGSGKVSGRGASLGGNLNTPGPFSSSQLIAEGTRTFPRLNWEPKKEPSSQGRCARPGAIKPDPTHLATPPWALSTGAPVTGDGRGILAGPGGLPPPGC